MDFSGSYASAVIVKPIFLPSNTKRLSTEKRDSDKLALCFAKPGARFHISPPSQDSFHSSLSEEKQPWEPGCSLASLISYICSLRLIEATNLMLDLPDSKSSGRHYKEGMWMFRID